MAHPLLRARPGVLGEGNLQVLIHHPQVSEATMADVAGRMATAAGGKLTGPVHRRDRVGELLEQLHSQQLAFFGVAALALAISGLGMLNIGLASVRERARELVIRRAVGATRSGIMAQMLISAILVGVLAAAVAIVVAIVGVAWWLPQRINPATGIQPPPLPWAAGAWGLAAAVVTTVVGALIPALVAARLDVATALRD